MSHECDECGETFETLTRLRLHDCSGTVNTGLEISVEQVEQGDIGILYQAVADFSTALETARDTDETGETFRDLFWEYYEPLANGLDKAARREGWPFLADLIAAYDPRPEEEVPLSSPVIENAVGRFLVRTRLTDGVDAIPVEAINYLRVIPDLTEGDIEWEESFTYGWGIAHPEHSFTDQMFTAVRDHPLWVQAVLEHSFYADQLAALELLIDLITDDAITFSISHPTGKLDKPRVLLNSVSSLDNEDRWPQLPRYWDWHDKLDYSFEWDPDVEQRIQRLVTETGVDEDLPHDWTFKDLAL